MNRCWACVEARRFALTRACVLAGLLVVVGSVGCNPFDSGSKKQDTPGPVLPIASAAVGAWGAGVASTTLTAPTGPVEFDHDDGNKHFPPDMGPLAPAEPEGDGDGAAGGSPGGADRPDGVDGGVPPIKTGKPPVVTL